MQSIIEQITDWLRTMLVSGIMDNLTGMFDSVNQQVTNMTGNIGMTPAEFSPGIFSLIQNITETVILPVAGMILTFVACYELIQMIIEHNNLANLDTWIFIKWIFKTYIAIVLISNTFNITMAIFDVAQHVVNESGGLISQSTSIDASALSAMEEQLMATELGVLLSIFMQTLFVQVGTQILAIVIFIIVYGRMIEIYLSTSLAPIPLATLANKEQGAMGQNYLRSLAALGFQGFLMMICIGIYAVLIQSITFSEDIVASIWGVLGYTVLLAFTLFKTYNLSKSIFNAN